MEEINNIMEEINNINSYITNKLSVIPKLTFFDNDYMCVTTETQLEWLNFNNLINVSQERLWKSEITLDTGEKKNIIIKIYGAHSLQNTEGKDFLENVVRKNNITTKINILRENYSYFNYTYNNILIKSSIKFTNTKFINWSTYLYDKYINIDIIEHLEDYVSFKKFKDTNSFNDILKITIKIFDIIKILLDNNLIMNDFEMSNILIKGDISSNELKLIDYEQMVEVTNEQLNLKTLTSIYELEQFNDVQLKDKNIVNVEEEIEPNIFSYIYMKDYLYLLTSMCSEYEYTNEYNIIYGIIKHCVDNSLTVTDAKTYIETNFINV